MIKLFAGLVVTIVALRLLSTGIEGLYGWLSDLGSQVSASTPPAASSGGSEGSGASASTVRQIACWAYEGGWSPSDIPTADAITFPESGGNPNAVQQGQPAALTGWGLWQITPGDASLLDPVANARAAHEKFASQGWDAWTTYTGGQYQQYLPTVQADLAGFDYASCGRAA